MTIRLKTEGDLVLLRESGRILSEVLAMLTEKAKEGVVLIELEKEARKIITRYNATPTFLGYISEGSRMPYPAAICTSVNETIVHGIPGNYILKNGDIISIDVGITYKGRITDGAATKGIGKISKEEKKLIEGTREALRKGIKECKIGNTVGDIGAAIEKIAQREHLGIAQGLTGHGVGFSLHEDPNIYNFGKKKTGIVLKKGMVLAIEPMFSLGNGEIEEGENGEFNTLDGAKAAHFEQTIAISDNGPEVLTKIP